jgi:uncharacterized membrane protein YfcA
MQEFIQNYFAINSNTGFVELNGLVVVLLILAGFTVGVINTVAGAGTAITYSLFMFLGLPANMANGTIRFGVIMQTLASSATFACHKKLEWKKGLWLSIPIIIGTIIGATIAVAMNQDAFKKILGVVLLAMLIFIFYDPKRWLVEQIQKTKKRISLVQYLL